MKPGPIVVAQLGCGYWGPNLLRNLRAQPDCHVKLVCEPRAERRAYVAEAFSGVDLADQAAAALDDPEIAAVVVATPADTHHALTRAALLAGKHVLVEKPLALELDHAEELGALAAERALVLMAGHTFLYNAAVRFVRELVAAGELGDLLYAYTQRLNLGQARTDVNAWWNLAPHDVSILLYLLGGELPESVALHGACRIQPGIEDVVFGLLRWPGGLTAHVHASWLDPGKVRRVTLVGSRKMAVYDDMAEARVTIADKGVDRVPRAGERMDYDRPGGWHLLHRAGDVVIPRVAGEEPLRVEVRHFLDCVRTGATPLTGPGHARDVVAVLAAGEQSLRSGGAAAPVAPRRPE